tara:strand:- start:86 stop:358 length:273 start_codon:yes stop_codon:yes gene_type:complete
MAGGMRLSVSAAVKNRSCSPLTSFKRLLHLFNELPLLELVPFPVALSRFFKRLYRPLVPASAPYFVLSCDPSIHPEFVRDTPVVEIGAFH